MDTLSRRIKQLQINYEGVEDYAELSRLPSTHLQIALAISRLAPMLANQDHLVDVVLDEIEEACCWHARIGSERWNPLKESFESFAGRGEVVIWEDNRPTPAREVVRRWLLDEAG